MVLERVLSRAGYDVRVVEDGEAACEAAKQAAFDLVVLDIVMPTMNGREALKKIRTLLPEARFILSSGYTAHATSTELLESGATELLAKP